MKNLALGALIDVVRTQNKRAQEKTRVAEWTRHNATVERALPALPDDNDTEMGLLYAIATAGEDASGAGGGQDGSSHDAAAGAGGAPNGNAAEGGAGNASANPAGVGGHGEAQGGGQPAHPGGGAGNPGAAGVGNPRSPWASRGLKIAAAVLMTAGGGGLGYAIHDWLAGDEITVIEQPADGSLYQWLEDQGYHLPPEQNE